MTTSASIVLKMAIKKSFNLDDNKCKYRTKTSSAQAINIKTAYG